MNNSFDPEETSKNDKMQENEARTNTETYMQEEVVGNSSSNGGPFYSSSQPKKKKTLSPMTSCILICIVISMFFGVIGAVGGAAVMRSVYNNSEIVNEVVIESKKLNLSSENAGDVATVAANCVSSVVSINTTFVVNGSTSGTGSGSGVFITTDGYIVTCNHVVDGASAITVTTYGGTQYNARLIGKDSWSDIAVIKIDGYTGFPYKALTTAEDGEEYMCLGEQIVVIGNPLGQLPFSVSSGVISGLNRKITIEGVQLKLTQIDAAVNPGNSGGAMFDMYGNLIGIINAKSVSEDVEGIGYAIPSDYALSVVTELINKGYVSDRPWIGISYQAKQVNLNYYYEIKSYLFGDELKEGDLIAAIDGVQINYSGMPSQQILEILSNKSVNDNIVFDVYRYNSSTRMYELLTGITIRVHSGDEYNAAISGSY